MAEEAEKIQLAEKVIVAMKGHPGTGKSTLAFAIAAALKIPLIDKDDIKDSTFSLYHHQISPSLLNDVSYDAVWRVAATQLRVGLGVIVDSPLSRRCQLDELLRVASAAGDARAVVVECKASDEAEWRRRVEARGRSDHASWHKPSTWRDLERLLEDYGGCTEYDVGDVPRIIVDTTGSAGTKKVVSSVVEFIVSNNGPSL